jgi:hypothetical protein
MEIENLIQANLGLVLTVTTEEDRFERVLRSLPEKRDMVVWTPHGGLDPAPEGKPPSSEPSTALRLVTKARYARRPAIWLFRDLMPYVTRNPLLQSLMKELGREVRKSARESIIILSPQADLPPSLQNEIYVYSFPRPDRRYVTYLMAETEREFARLGLEAFENPVQRTQSVNALLGLTEREMERSLSLSLVQRGRIDPHFLQHQRVRALTGIPLKILMPYEISVHTDCFGGYGRLVSWFRKRKRAFVENLPLPHPRGAALLGITGTGKSLFARFLARLWDVPLVLFDYAAIFAPTVGSTERNLARVLRILESLDFPYILVLDEAEKALSGGTSDLSDGGSARRALGRFLEYLQRTDRNNFLLLIANELRGIPPELIRPGRLDSVFYFDLPDRKQRRDILTVLMRKLGISPENLNPELLARHTENFTGSELEQVLLESIYSRLEAVDEPRQPYVLTDVQILGEIKKTRPLALRHPELRHQREFARHNFLLA